MASPLAYRTGRGASGVASGGGRREHRTCPFIRHLTPPELRRETSPEQPLRRRLYGSVRVAKMGDVLSKVEGKDLDDTRAHYCDHGAVVLLPQHAILSRMTRLLLLRFKHPGYPVGRQPWSQKG